MTRTALTYLARLLEEATEGSQELDAHISAALRLTPADAETWLVEWDGPFEAHRNRHGWRVRTKDGGINWEPARLSTSIDAALALVERLFPGAWWFVRKRLDSAGGYLAKIEPLDAPFESQQAMADTPALSILRALVSALVAKANAVMDNNRDPHFTDQPASNMPWLTDDDAP